MKKKQVRWSTGDIEDIPFSNENDKRLIVEVKCGDKKDE